MAFDLTARLRLIDNMSAPLRRATRGMNDARRASDVYRDAQGRLRNSLGQFTRASRSQTNAIESVGSSMRSASSSARSLIGTLGALGAAYAAARFASKAFDLTIGEAARYEMQDVTVRALFGGDKAKKQADSYMDYVQQRAAETMFSVSDYMDSGRFFITRSKDVKQLEKMYDLAERLGAYDPIQGMRGAGFALNELFSGDSVSLVERFEMDRSVLNVIKKLPTLQKQIEAMDQYLNKKGITKGLIDDQAATAIGQYSQAVDKMKIALRKMGMEGLEYIKPMLVRFNNFLSGTKFDQWSKKAAAVFGGVTGHITSAVDKVVQYVNTRFIDNPFFQGLNMQDKISFVLQNLMTTIRAWLDAEGKAQIQKFVNTAVLAVADALTLNAPLLAEAAINIGGQIASGIASGLVNGLRQTALLQMISPWLRGEETVKGITRFDDKVKEHQAKYGANASNVPLYANTTLSGKTDKEYSWYDPRGWDFLSHHTGLNRVPYDGYTARLHEGERVLTASEASAQDREGRGSYGGPLIGTVIVNNDSDYEVIAGKLARMLIQAEEARTIGN